MNNTAQWLVMIGNSRIHWADFEQNVLKKTWHTPHLTPADPSVVIPSDLPLYLASVVPAQTAFFRNYPRLSEIKLEDIPLKKLYPTLGIDRALAALGAGDKYGYPCLVIDLGTALTLTGIDPEKNFFGGAILPGLRLQFQSLSQTAALPEVILPEQLPLLWANTTQSAIESGILYTTLAGLHYFIQDWLTLFPETTIVLTGGDSPIIYPHLLQLFPQFTSQSKLEPDLIFWGMRSLISSL